LPEEIWEELRKLPSALQLNQTAIPSKTASNAAWQAGLNGVTSPYLWMVLTALIGLSVGMYILRHQAQFRSVAVSMTTQAASWTELMEWVASGQRVSAQPKEVLRAQWSALRLLQRHLEPSKLSRLTGFGALNARERAFLEHVALGQRSKDFARLHGLSAGYVYNLSSSVRAKLHVPENQDLAQWLESQ
jgi:DNA-binding CsgD family transcriptional regulator